MIAMLTGRVETIDADAVLIDVSGVGYEVRMPTADVAAMHAGQETKIFTSLSISQDSMALYGFLSQASKRMFLQLQKVSGIGPRVALSLLSTLGANRVAQAVSQGDATALSKAPGLGKKGAQKIILELKGSIDLDAINDAGTQTPSSFDTGVAQVVEGLISLGWRPQDAQRAVQSVCDDNDIGAPLPAEDVPKVLRLALASLDRGR